MSNDVYHLSRDTIRLLCPMYVTIDGSGLIADIGPTLASMFERSILGHNFFDIFTVEKPRRIDDIHKLQHKVASKANMPKLCFEHLANQAFTRPTVNASKIHGLERKNTLQFSL